MLTRRQPVAIAAASDSSSRMPPLISTWMSRVPTILGLQLAVVAAAERGVEVDQVQPLGAGLLPAQRRLDRVAEPLLGAGDALDQLDGLAARDVDGGQQLEVVAHGRDPRERRLPRRTRRRTAGARPSRPPGHAVSGAPSSNLYLTTNPGPGSSSGWSAVVLL